MGASFFILSNEKIEKIEGGPIIFLSSNISATIVRWATGNEWPLVTFAYFCQQCAASRYAWYFDLFAENFLPMTNYELFFNIFQDKDSDRDITTARNILGCNNCKNSRFLQCVICLQDQGNIVCSIYRVQIPIRWPPHPHIVFVLLLLVAQHIASVLMDLFR